MDSLECTTHENQNGSTRVSQGVLLNPAIIVLCGFVWQGFTFSLPNAVPIQFSTNTSPFKGVPAPPIEGLDPA